MRTRPMNFVLVSLILIVIESILNKKVKECTDYTEFIITHLKMNLFYFMTPLFYLCVEASLYHNIEMLFPQNCAYYHSQGYLLNTNQAAI